MEASTLNQETREELIRRAWYMHDARWFAAVTAEFGIEAANRLNRRAVRSTAEAEAGRLARALGTPAAADLGEFVAFLEAGRQLYVAPPLMEMRVSQVDEETYEVRIERCFIFEHITRAGIAGTYECAVFDRVDGWHAALKLPLAADQLPALACLRARGEECRRLLRVEKKGTHGTAN